MINETFLKSDDPAAAPGRNGLTGAALGVGLLAGCLAAPERASAAVILSNLGAGVDGQNNFNSGGIGQVFTVGAHAVSLESVTVTLDLFGAKTTNAGLSLYSVVADLPATELATTPHIFGGTFGDYTFSLPKAYTLSAGTSYAIVMRGSSAAWAFTNQSGGTSDFNPPAASFGDNAFAVGGTWTAYGNGSTQIMSLNGTAVPEPATLTLFGAGLVATWLKGRRRGASDPVAT